MHRPRKKYEVEYRLWVDDFVLGSHISISWKKYYTKLGAKLDAFLKVGSTPGNVAKLQRLGKDDHADRA